MVDQINERSLLLEFPAEFPEYNQIEAYPKEQIDYLTIQNLLTLIADSKLKGQHEYLDQTVSFGNEKPQKLSAFCIDLNNQTQAKSLFKEIMDNTTTDHQGGLLINFTAPRFLILPKGCHYTKTGGVIDTGKLYFHARRLTEKPETVSLCPVLNDNSVMARKANKGYFVIAAHQFILHEMENFTDRNPCYALGFKDVYTARGFIPKSDLSKCKALQL